MNGRRNKAQPPEPGKRSYYDKTRKLNLSPEEIAAGWTVETCISCEAGHRRQMRTCELCGGTGLFAAFNGNTDRPPGGDHLPAP